MALSATQSETQLLSASGCGAGGHCVPMASHTPGTANAQKFPQSYHLGSLCALTALHFLIDLLQVQFVLVRRENQEHFLHAALQHAAVKLVLGT